MLHPCAPKRPQNPNLWDPKPLDLKGAPQASLTKEPHLGFGPAYVGIGVCMYVCMYACIYVGMYLLCHCVDLCLACEPGCSAAGSCRVGSRPPKGAQWLLRETNPAFSSPHRIADLWEVRAWTRLVRDWPEPHRQQGSSLISWLLRYLPPA